MDDERLTKDEVMTGGGLECPECGCRHFYVIWTRQQVRRIVRARKCRHCGKVVRTSERIVGGGGLTKL